MKRPHVSVSGTPNAPKYLMPDLLTDLINEAIDEAPERVPFEFVSHGVVEEYDGSSTVLKGAELKAVWDNPEESSRGVSLAIWWDVAKMRRAHTRMMATIQDEVQKRSKLLP